MVDKKGFTHFNEEGEAVMVDVSQKDQTEREAIAQGYIKVSLEIMKAIIDKNIKKGDVLSVARLAGIMATKSTSQIIPLCHLLQITSSSVDFEIDEEGLKIKAICKVKTVGKTGVEMEALHGVSVALLTIYDMCKALDKGMEITDISLLEKSGGKSGEYKK